MRLPVANCRIFFLCKCWFTVLYSGDVWAVVGWSDDLVKLGERTSSVEVLAPASGTALWADLWTVPAHAKVSDRGVNEGFVRLLVLATASSLLVGVPVLVMTVSSNVSIQILARVNVLARMHLFLRLVS